MQRRELESLNDAELFSYALLHRFSIASETAARPGPSLAYSFCYGCGYSDTKFWAIGYAVSERGLPKFTDTNRQSVLMILCGDHLVTWNAIKNAGSATDDARREHAKFLASA